MLQCNPDRSRDALSPVCRIFCSGGDGLVFAGGALLVGGGSVCDGWAWC